MTTRYKLEEQITRELKGGNTMGGRFPHKMEVFEAINQSINFLLKGEWFAGMNVDGQRVAEGLCLAFYDGITVESYKNVSRATLPAMPILLPRNLGVYYIGPTNGTDSSGSSNDLDTPFIPIPAGLKAMLGTEPLISDLMGQYGYEVFGDKVIFTEDLTRESPPITQVCMRLLVMDISEYSDYQTLPIPADMEPKIIEMCINRFRGTPEAARINDQVAGGKTITR
jgi:hypothetical protein